MLNRVESVALVCLFFTAAASGQTQNSDSQTLRQILVELRAIHEDMRLSESTQFLLAEYQMQQGIVTHAMQDADNARTQLNGIHEDQKQVAAELERLQDKLEKAANVDERNAMNQKIEDDNSHLAGLKTADRDWNTTLLDMQQRLQNAQDKLASIASELNAAITRFGTASKGAGQR